jgi:hypothetical protein
MNEKSELESKQLRHYDGSKFPSQPKRPRGPRTRSLLDGLRTDEVEWVQVAFRLWVNWNLRG